MKQSKLCQKCGKESEREVGWRWDLCDECNPGKCAFTTFGPVNQWGAIECDDCGAMLSGWDAASQHSRFHNILNSHTRELAHARTDHEIAGCRRD